MTSYTVWVHSVPALKLCATYSTTLPDISHNHHPYTCMVKTGSCASHTRTHYATAVELSASVADTAAAALNNCHAAARHVHPFATQAHPLRQWQAARCIAAEQVVEQRCAQWVAARLAVGPAGPAVVGTAESVPGGAGGVAWLDVVRGTVEDAEGAAAGGTVGGAGGAA